MFLSPFTGGPLTHNISDGNITNQLTGMMTSKIMELVGVQVILVAGVNACSITLSIGNTSNNLCNPVEISANAGQTVKHGFVVPSFNAEQIAYSTVVSGGPDGWYEISLGCVSN